MAETTWTLPDKGVLFVVTGPSGVGKSTLIGKAQDAVGGLEFSVSATTRTRRTNETDGEDYHFLTEQDFAEHLRKDAFFEHAEVYGHRYGTLKEPIEQALLRGASILLDIDLAGARQVREAKPDAILIYILPPSLDALEQRLRSRATDSDKVIRTRMQSVAEQMLGCGEFDYLLKNDSLDEAHRVFQGILLAEMSRTEARMSWVTQMLQEIGRLS